MPDYPKPAMRRLRVYAFDPQASVTLSTAMINESIIELPWEERWATPLRPGPVNDYLEVIDHDPASRLFYAPVDLDHPDLLAQDGLSPSEGRPQFHQQMVFAVAMFTIHAFERALGRFVLWARDEADMESSGGLAAIDRNFTRRLRIYPHALREANAYYSPVKRALLFGYFRPDEAAVDVQANWVFTCLSQDIIAHETAHAILHGIRQRSIEPSNIDALAFHEAFADIIALLQRFAFRPVVRHMLAASNGSLRDHSLLTGLGEQFGKATGRNGALRYALRALGDRAERPVDNSAQSIRDAIATLGKTTESHARGGFLVAAVFDAFVTIYERRSADLFRMARPGLVAGNGLSPDLVNRLAAEASEAAGQVMRMCIRALDYAPPIDLRFGEYLRAIITADTDLVPNDPLRYRVAFVEAFKRWGITVPGSISMAPDSLVWDPPEYEKYPEIQAYAKSKLPGRRSGSQPLRDPGDAFSIRFTEMLGHLMFGVSFSQRTSSSTSYRMKDYAPDRSSRDESDEPSRHLRDKAMEIVIHNQREIHRWFNSDSDDDEDWESLVGLRLRPQVRTVGVGQSREKRIRQRMRSIPVEMGDEKTLPLQFAHGVPKFEISSARIARRTGPNGQETHHLIFQIIQRRRGYFDRNDQRQADRGHIRSIGHYRWNNPDFWFRGGATVHIDLRDGRLLRVIRKRIDDNRRLEEERAYRCGETAGIAANSAGTEPFAFVHRSD